MDRFDSRRTFLNLMAAGAVARSIAVAAEPDEDS